MNRKLKIAIIAPCPFPYNRGTPVRIFEIASKLSELGQDVHVFTYHLGEVTKDVNFKIHRIEDIKNYKKYSPGPTLRKLFHVDIVLTSLIWREFRSNKFDIIHGHNYEGLIIGLIIKRNFHIPLVYDAHNTLESELPYYFWYIPKFIKSWAGRFLDRYLSRLADAIVSVTPDIKSKLIHMHNINPDIIKVIGNGADVEHFNKSGFKIKKSPPGIKRNILYAGNTASYQRIDLLLDIYSLIKNENKNVYLNLVTNSSFNEYTSKAEKMGIADNIKLYNTDFSSLPEIFRHSEVALNTRTDCDGIPLKLLNYMSAGLPVVSFEGSAKIIKNNDTGFVIKNGDIRSFASTVLQLLNNAELAGQIGMNAFEYVKSNYSWEKTAENIYQVYIEILDKALQT